MDAQLGSSARSKGLRALSVASAAFAQLPDEELDAIAARAIHEAREVLGVTPVLMMNRVGVSRTITQEPSASAPSLTATLSSTPS